MRYGTRCLLPCSKVETLAFMIITTQGINTFVQTLYFHKVVIGASLSEPHTGSSLFNCGMMVAFLKVYVSSTEGLAPHVACS